MTRGEVNRADFYFKHRSAINRAQFIGSAIAVSGLFLGLNSLASEYVLGENLMDKLGAELDIDPSYLPTPFQTLLASFGALALVLTVNYRYQMPYEKMRSEDGKARLSQPDLEGRYR